MIQLHGFSLIDVLVALGVLLLTAATALTLVSKAQLSSSLAREQAAFTNIFQHTLALEPEQLAHAGRLGFDFHGIALSGEREPHFILSWEPVQTSGTPSVTFRLQYPSTTGQEAALSWTRRWRKHARV